MKKKFKNTRAFRILAAAARVAAKKVPVVGELVENVESKDRGVGRLDPDKLVNQLIRLTLLVVAIRQYSKGNLSLHSLFDLFHL